MSLYIEKYYTNWIELDIKKFKNNIKSISNQNNDKQIWAVVKDDAYNHGIDLLFKYFIEAKVYSFCVLTLDEAKQIQYFADKLNVKINVLILGYIPLNGIEEILDNWHITIYNRDFITCLRKLSFKNTINCHIKIDTGMNRKGFKNKKDFYEILDIINNIDNLIITGIYTHFSSSFTDIEYMEYQMKKFKNIIKNVNYDNYLIHSQNSYGTVNLDRSYSCINNMIRPGGFCYGLTAIEREGFFPIISLYSTVIDKKKVIIGETIGYDNTYKFKKNGFIGIITLGYAHGFFRSNTNLYIYINNKKKQIVGKICMDQCMFYSEKDDFKINDKVEIFGHNNSIFEVANHNHVDDYELVCGLSKKIKRICIL